MTQWGLDTLFNPGKRHMDEEKQRLQNTREEAGDSSGGKRIDLESGRVTIARGNGEHDSEREEDDDADLSPAQRRARERRRRTAKNQSPA